MLNASKDLRDLGGDVNEGIFESMLRFFKKHNKN